MAVLDQNQAAEKLKTTKNSQKIDELKYHTQRLHFHTQPVISSRNASPYFAEWTRDYVFSPLPEERHKSFLDRVKFPLPTVELTDSIFTELSRAFEADDQNIEFEFKSAENIDDFLMYLENQDDNKFWTQTAPEIIKNKLFGLMIIDLPEEQTSDRPEPYFYLLDVGKIKGIEVNDKGFVEWVAFESKDKFYVFDDVNYRRYRKDDKGDYINELDTPHFIGWTPAKLFWDDDSSPISKSLTELDKLLWWEAAIEYYKSYGVFPVVWRYKVDCDYVDETLPGNAVKCEGGLINRIVLENNQEVIRSRACPQCSVKSVGIGALMEFDPPSGQGDADLREPMGFISIDVAALKYIDESHERNKEKLFSYCVGFGGEPNNEQAKNLKQVQAGFESRQNVLVKLKRNVETIRRFVYETMSRLRYGDDFIKCIVNLGEKFYLQPIEEIDKEYQAAKVSGKPNYLISQLRELSSETRFKNNPDLKQRAYILSNLEPFPDLILKDLIELQSSIPEFVSDEDIIVKMRFSEFIARFEREIMNIIRFGSGTTFSNKINQIKTKLYEYATESRKPDAGPRVYGSRNAETAPRPVNGSGQNNNQEGERQGVFNTTV